MAEAEGEVAEAEGETTEGGSCRWISEMVKVFSQTVYLWGFLLEEKVCLWDCTPVKLGRAWVGLDCSQLFGSMLA